MRCPPSKTSASLTAMATEQERQKFFKRMTVRLRADAGVIGTEQEESAYYQVTGGGGDTSAEQLEITTDEVHESESATEDATTKTKKPLSQPSRLMDRADHLGVLVAMHVSMVLGMLQSSERRIVHPVTDSE